MKTEKSTQTITTLGWAKVPNVLIDNQFNLSGSALRILLVVLRYEKAYPSYTKISHKTGLSRQSISNGIKELTKRNIIKVDHGDKSRSNYYMVQSIDRWEFTIKDSKSDRDDLNRLPKSNVWASESLISELKEVQSLDAIKNKISDKNKTKLTTKDKMVGKDLVKSKPTTELNERQTAFLKELNSVLQSNRFLDSHKKLESLLGEFGFVFNMNEIIEIFEKQFANTPKYRDRMVEPLEHMLIRISDRLDYEDNASGLYNSEGDDLLDQLTKELGMDDDYEDESD